MNATRQVMLLAAEPGMEPIIEILDRLRTYMVAILVTLSVVFMTYAGIRYVVAGGDPSGVERAKGAVKSAIVGLGLALLAPALVALVKQIVGG